MSIIFTSELIIIIITILKLGESYFDNEYPKKKLI